MYGQQSQSTSQNLEVDQNSPTASLSLDAGGRQPYECRFPLTDFLFVSGNSLLGGVQNDPSSAEIHDNMRVAFESLGQEAKHDREQQMDQYWQQQGIHRVREYVPEKCREMGFEKEAWYQECLKGTLVSTEESLCSGDVCRGQQRPPEGNVGEYVLGSHRLKSDNQDKDIDCIVTNHGIYQFECGQYAKWKQRIKYVDVKYVQLRQAVLTPSKEASWRSGHILIQTSHSTQQVGVNIGALGQVQQLCMFVLKQTCEVRILQLKLSVPKELNVSAAMGGTIVMSPYSATSSKGSASTVSNPSKPTISKVAKLQGTKEEQQTQYQSTPPAKKRTIEKKEDRSFEFPTVNRASLGTFVEDEEVLVRRDARSTQHMSPQLQKPIVPTQKMPNSVSLQVERGRRQIQPFIQNDKIGVDQYDQNKCYKAQVSHTKTYTLGLGVRSLGWERSSVCSGLSRLSTRQIAPNSLPSRYSRRRSVPVIDGSMDAVVTQLLRQATAAWTIALDFLERTSPSAHPPSLRIFGNIGVHSEISSIQSKQNTLPSQPIPLDGAVLHGQFQHQVLLTVVATIQEHILVSTAVTPLVHASKQVLDCTSSLDRAKEVKNLTEKLTAFLRMQTSSMYLCFIGDACARSDAYHTSGGLTAFQMACCAQASDRQIPIHHSGVTLQDWLKQHPGVTGFIPDRSPEPQTSTRTLFTTSCVQFMRQISENINPTKPVYSASYKSGLCHCCLQPEKIQKQRTCEQCNGVVCISCSTKRNITAVYIRLKEGFVQSPGFTPIVNITSTITCRKDVKTLVCEPCLHITKLHQPCIGTAYTAYKDSLGHQQEEAQIYTHLLHPENAQEVCMPLPNHGQAIYTPQMQRRTPLSWEFTSFSELAIMSSAITAIPNPLEFHPVSLQQAIVYVNNNAFTPYIGIPHLHVTIPSTQEDMPIYQQPTYIPPSTTLFLANKYNTVRSSWHRKLSLLTQGTQPTIETQYQHFFKPSKYIGEELALYTADLVINDDNNFYKTQIQEYKLGEVAPESTKQCVLSAVSAVSMGAQRNIRNICSFGKLAEIPYLHHLCSQLESLYCKERTEEQVIPEVDIPDQHCFQVSSTIREAGVCDMLVQTQKHIPVALEEDRTFVEVLGEVVRKGEKYTLRNIRVSQTDEHVLSAIGTYFGRSEQKCNTSHNLLDEEYLVDEDDKYDDDRLGEIHDEMVLPGILPSIVADEPTDHVTLVFTDIESSTKQWEHDSAAMDHALNAHEYIFRLLLIAHKGYEVKTEGDAFMIAFSSVIDAIQWAVNTQRLQCSTLWPQEISEISKQMLWSTPPPVLPDIVVHVAQTVSAAGDVHLEAQPVELGVPPARSSFCPFLFNGIRVRMGLHFDTPQCKRNPVTMRQDYFGVVVNRAARVADSAHGGQVVCTNTVQAGFEDWKQQCLKWGLLWTTVARKQHALSDNISVLDTKLELLRLEIEDTERKLIQCRTDNAIRATQEDQAAQYKQFSVKSNDVGKLNVALQNTERDRLVIEQKLEHLMPPDSFEQQYTDVKLQEQLFGSTVETPIMENRIKSLLLTSEDMLEQQNQFHHGKFTFKGVGESLDVYELQDVQLKARSSYFDDLRAEKHLEEQDAEY